MSQQQLTTLPSPFLPSPRLPPELLGRIIHFVSLPNEDLFQYEDEWESSHKELRSLALVNRTFAAFARLRAWRKSVWSEKNTYESGIAHLYHANTIRPFVQELAWCLTRAFSKTSLIVLPLLSALTSFAFSPNESEDYEVARGVTALFSGITSLRRFQIRYCGGWEDETFSLGQVVVPSLRVLIVDLIWWQEGLPDQELGSLEVLACTVSFWSELVLGSSSARGGSLSTLRELHLCEAWNVDEDGVLPRCKELVARHLGSMVSAGLGSSFAGALTLLARQPAPRSSLSKCSPAAFLARSKHQTHWLACYWLSVLPHYSARLSSSTPASLMSTWCEPPPPGLGER